MRNDVRDITIPDQRERGDKYLAYGQYHVRLVKFLTGHPDPELLTESPFTREELSGITVDVFKRVLETPYLREKAGARLGDIELSYRDIKDIHESHHTIGRPRKYTKADKEKERKDHFNKFLASVPEYANK